jgi:LPXTG-motif cell wall-anchored protein
MSDTTTTNPDYGHQPPPSTGPTTTAVTTTTQPTQQSVVHHEGKLPITGSDGLGLLAIIGVAAIFGGLVLRRKSNA